MGGALSLQQAPKKSPIVRTQFNGKKKKENPGQKKKKNNTQLGAHFMPSAGGGSSAGGGGEALTGGNGSTPASADGGRCESGIKQRGADQRSCLD